ncbi:MAG: organic solvent tolerance protein OstA [Bacteroidales bacterium]|jgi:lipopolysaccharide export system protein LptA|nr:organic solvent tolerance protein OstA [Bacteroidales bacterium]
MKRYLVIFLFLIELLFVSELVAQKKEQIYIRNSNLTEFSKTKFEGARRFTGNVIFEHQNATMYCDSAYIYGTQNIIHAFSNVHVSRGDTLHLYGDYMLYNGNTNIGKFRNNVRLEDDQTTLYTDSLDFNNALNIAYYFEGGRIINEENTLTSDIGYYYANDDMFFYKDSVVMVNPDYTVYSDTLQYNTTSKIAYFLGPTDIYNEENYLYGENGWYKTAEKKFQFNENARLENKDKILSGDSLFYDELNGIGIAIKNVEMIDTLENLILKGNYAYYTKEPESFLITDSTLLIQVSNSTDSLFLHSDTISSLYDSSGIHRIIKAYHKVQIFKEDFQARCDSMIYNFKDSVISMYTDPMLWAEGNQMTAKKVEIHLKDDELDFFKLMQTAFIVSQKDTSSYDQIRGKEMFGYIRNNKLHRIDVFGNGQTIYFMVDEKVNEIIGVNFAESSDLKIYMNNGFLSRINLIKEPAGTLYPLDQLEEKKLKDFRWLEQLRPKSKKDIFYWE